MMMFRQNIAMFFLRIGIAAVFLYAAIASLVEYSNWIGFIPLWFRNLTSPLISSETLLFGFAIYQIVLALWLLLGRKTAAAAVLSAVTLFGIMAVNLGAFDIVFRDIAVLFAALALALLSKE